MAERDADREEREERGDRQERADLGRGQDPEGQQDSDTEPGREREDREEPAQDGGKSTGEGPAPQEGVSPDEDAAWAAIVAGYGQEPPDPPGAKPFKSVEDLALLEPETNDERPERPSPARPLGSSIAFAPGVGPRDHSLAEPSDDDLGEDDEGHFVPPEPPPLPRGDATSRFAWLGVLGGPVLLLLAVLLDWYMSWWLTTLTIGGFLGGFATLFLRMRTGDEDDDDPGRGAVV